MSNNQDETFRSEVFQAQNTTLRRGPSFSAARSQMIKCFHDGPPFLPSYRSSKVQLGLIACISFLCPGMWNTLNGLGGGGLVQAGPANNSNTALYATFSITGFFAGIATNKLGVRITLSLGGLGYLLYASSLLCYKHTQNEGFLLYAGLQLGVCAGVFWAAQSMTVISYPTSKSTGKSISWFWMIYNLGPVVGSGLALGLNMHSERNDLSDDTYYIVISLSFLGIILALLLTDAKDVLRSDGTKVIHAQIPTWKSEIDGCIGALRSDYYILLFFPMFFASNFFHPYQFNTFNLRNFTMRTRSLNNAVYWLSEIAGALLVGPALDSKRLRRSVKARLAILILLIITCATWGGAYVWQVENDDKIKHFEKMDFVDRGYLKAMALYMSLGLLASAYQTCLLWFLRSLTNDSRKLANFVGFYKGIQSAGGAVSFRVNTLGLYPTHELAMCWSLLVGSLVVAAPVTLARIQDDQLDLVVEAT